jgi:hypothetical protein
VKNQASVDLVWKDHVVVVDLVQKELSCAYFMQNFLRIYHLEQFSVDFCVSENSVYIPKDVPADVDTQSNFLRIFQFKKIPQVFPRIYMRILAPHFLTDFTISGNYVCNFWLYFLKILHRIFSTLQNLDSHSRNLTVINLTQNQNWNSIPNQHCHEHLLWTFVVSCTIVNLRRRLLCHRHGETFIARVQS